MHRKAKQEVSNNSQLRNIGKSIMEPDKIYDNHRESFDNVRDKYSKLLEDPFKPYSNKNPYFPGLNHKTFDDPSHLKLIS